MGFGLWESVASGRLRQMEFEGESGPPVDVAQRGFRLLLAAACLVVVIAGMREAASVFVPVILAFFFAVLSYPVMHWLTARGIPRFVSMLITLLMVIGVVVLIVMGGTTLLAEFQKDMPAYLVRLKASLEDTAKWLEERGVQGATDSISQFFDWSAIISYAAKQDVMQNIASFMGSTVGTVASFFSTFVLVLVLLVFILMEARGTMTRFMAVQLAGGPDFEKLIQSASDIQKYLGIKTALSALTGLLAYGWCLMMDLPYAPLWGIVAFVFNYVPVVGSIVAAVPPALVALGAGGLGEAVGVVIGYLAINLSIGNFLEPTLMGRRFGVSSLVIVLSVIFWGWLWGIVGMFLAVPLTMLMKMMLDNSEEFRWISVAMAKKRVRKGEVEVAGYDLDLEEGEMLGSGASTERPGRE